MNIQINPETEADIPQVHQLLTNEKNWDFPTPMTHPANLIKELRYNPTFIPNLSLVLKLENNIIGYALFTPIVVKGDHHSNVSLALAILTVLPKYRKLGFASQLVKKGIKKAQQLGFKSIATLGSLNYFQKFTFRPSDDFDIYYTHENQNHRCLLLELAPNGLEGVHGQIIFPTQSNYSLTSNE